MATATLTVNSSDNRRVIWEQYAKWSGHSIAQLRMVYAGRLLNTACWSATLADCGLTKECVLHSIQRVLGHDESGQQSILWQAVRSERLELLRNSPDPVDRAEYTDMLIDLSKYDKSGHSLAAPVLQFQCPVCTIATELGLSSGCEDPTTTQRVSGGPLLASLQRLALAAYVEATIDLHPSSPKYSYHGQYPHGEAAIYGFLQTCASAALQEVRGQLFTRIKCCLQLIRFLTFTPM